MEKSNNTIEKFERIIGWFAQNAKVTPAHLNQELATEKFQKIESLLDAKLPTIFKAMYNKYNGESGEGIGSFFGHSFLFLDQIISNLEFSKKLIKPVERKIKNPRASQSIIDQIIPLLKLLDKTWYKITGSCSPQSISGPYIYPSIDSIENERKSVNLDASKKNQIMELSEKLHDLESEDFKWDELNFTLYSDGNLEVERTDYNFDEELPLTSNPPEAIKLKYFHLTCLPVFSDGGGNFIGIDLDPATKGLKNQVIVFGRDEEDMYVLAEDLDCFFDRCLSEIDSNADDLIAGVHLHDYFRSRV